MSLNGNLISGGLVQHDSSSHADTGVVAGTYTSPLAFSVNSAGHITAAYESWDSTVTYNEGSVVLGSDCELYVSQVADNLNHDPTTDAINWFRLEKVVLDNITAGSGISVTVADTGVTITNTGGVGGPPTGSAGGALDGSYPNPGLAASVAGAGLSESSDVLSVNVDGSTIEINGDTLRVKAGGIGANELASTAVSPATYGSATQVPQVTVDQDGRITGASNVTITGTTPGGSAGGALDGTYPNPGLAASVAGSGLSESSDVLSVNVDDSTIEINADTLRLKDSGTTIAKLAKKPHGGFSWSGWTAAETTGAKASTTVQMPYDHAGASVTWTFTRAYVFLSTAPSGSAFTLNFDYDEGTTGAFSSDGSLLTSDISISAGNARGSANAAAFSKTTLASGSLVRLNITAVNSGVIAFVQLEFARLT